MSLWERYAFAVGLLIVFMGYLIGFALLFGSGLPSRLVQP